MGVKPTARVDYPPNRRRHMHKKPDAAGHAESATGYMLNALDHLEAAERQLKLSGWRGAEVGVRQAAARVRSWHDKVLGEVRDVQGGRL